MTAYPNKVKVTDKGRADPAVALSAGRPSPGTAAAPYHESPAVGCRRRIDLAHLQITGDDAISLATAMKVVGMEPPSGDEPRPDVRMPHSPAAPLEELAEADDIGPPPLAPRGAVVNSASAHVMAELCRDCEKDAARSKSAGDDAAPEVLQVARPRRDPASNAAPAGEIDACLVRLIAVWPRLPQKIRDAIAAIVNSMEQS